jgi:putative serine protease PepD
MSEQQGWAPDPADQQGRASSPAAQPTTAPADTTPAGTTPADTAPASTAPVSAAPAGTAPVSAAPAGTAPVSAAPVSTTPADTAPVSTTPAGIATPATAPVTPAAPASADFPADLPAALPASLWAASTPTASTPAASTPTAASTHRPFAAQTDNAGQHSAAAQLDHAAATHHAAAAQAGHAAAGQHPAAAQADHAANQYSAAAQADHAATQHSAAAQAGHAAAGQYSAAAQADHAAAGQHSVAPAQGHPVPHAWPANLAATGAGAGDVQAGSARTWPAAQHAGHAAQHAQGPRAAVEGPVQNWPAAQHAAAPYTGGQGNHFTGQGGLHAAQGGHGQHPGAGQDPRVWAAAAGTGQDQPHLPNAQLPPHVPHMQRPQQWAQQPQPGSVFVAPAVRRRSRVGLAVAGVVAAIGLSAVSAFGGGLAALELRPGKSNTVVSATNSSGSNAGATTTLSDVAAQVLPSVVSISTGNAVGSGVVITADGAILTNNHVVATARGTTVQVTFSGGQTAQAKIVGTEPSSDLAVIKIVGSGTYTPLAFGDSSTVKVGDTVLAVGSPLGLDGSVTAGIVSAINRTIDEGEDGQSAAAKISGAIQTDAAINPGNSGGALVNTAGQLVGINTAIATSGQTAGNIGVGFAISSNTAKTVAQRLLS